MLRNHDRVDGYSTEKPKRLAWLQRVLINTAVFPRSR
jgi:hypothetical protein